MRWLSASSLLHSIPGRWVHPSTSICASDSTVICLIESQRRNGRFGVLLSVLFNDGLNTITGGGLEPDVTAACARGPCHTRGSSKEVHTLLARCSCIICGECCAKVGNQNVGNRSGKPATRSNCASWPVSLLLNPVSLVNLKRPCVRIDIGYRSHGFTPNLSYLR